MPHHRRIRIVSALAVTVTVTVAGAGLLVGLDRLASRSSTSSQDAARKLRRPTVPRPASSEPAQPEVATLPPPPRPALAIPPPRPLRFPNRVAAWAPVSRAVAVTRFPSAASRIIGHLATRTPEGTRNIVLVIGRRVNARGRLWIRVRVPMLPNNTTGWVPRASLGGYGFVRTSLTVDLRSETLTLLRDGRRIFRSRVGVGKPGWPTPTGVFYVRDKLTDYRSPFYGPIAFGTSARSAVATDWPEGGFIGIHGTDRPDLLPGRVSHGCIRMRNADILALARLLPIGTPMTIR